MQQHTQQRNTHTADTAAHITEQHTQQDANTAKVAAHTAAEAATHTAAHTHSKGRKCT